MQWYKTCSQNLFVLMLFTCLLVSCFQQTKGPIPSRKTQPASNTQSVKPDLPPKIPLVGIFVDQTSTAENPDGSSWAKAFKTIKAAIANVGDSGKKIYVARGKYASATIFIFDRKNIHLEGGYAAGELYEKDLSLLTEKEYTILDAEQEQDLVALLGSTSDISFKGFSFENVKNGVAFQILGDEKKPIDRVLISDSQFVNNSNEGNSLSSGAGISASNVDNLTLLRIKFDNNKAKNSAAGISIMNSKNTLLKTLKFFNNSSSDKSAMDIKGSVDVRVEDAYFANTSHEDTISFHPTDNQSTLTIKGATFAANNVSLGYAGMIKIFFEKEAPKSPQLVLLKPITFDRSTLGFGVLLSVMFKNAPKHDSQNFLPFVQSYIDVADSGIDLLDTSLVRINP